MAQAAPGMGTQVSAAAPCIGSGNTSSATADPSSQHSRNLLLSSLRPEIFMIGIQYHYPNTRNQDDFLHNPAAQLGLWGRPLSLPHTLASAPQQTRQGWARMGMVRTFSSARGSPGPISLSSMNIGGRLQTPEIFPPAWHGVCKPPTLIQAVRRNPQDEEH